MSWNIAKNNKGMYKRLCAIVSRPGSKTPLSLSKDHNKWLYYTQFQQNTPSAKPLYLQIKVPVSKLKACGQHFNIPLRRGVF